MKVGPPDIGGKAPKGPKGISPMHQHLQARALASHEPKPQRPRVAPIGTLLAGVHHQQNVQAKAQLRQLRQDQGEPKRMAQAQKLAYRAAKPRPTTIKQDKQFVRQGAEFFTGYQQLQHPLRDPLAAGFAAAGLIPGIGKLGKIGEVIRAGEEGGAAVRAGRSAEEAAQHVGEATSEAKTKGFGSIAQKPHEPPRVPPGESTPGTGGPLGVKVRRGLKGAGTARNQQDVLYSAERAKRAGMAEEAMKVGGQEGYHAALKELKGELPKIDFQGFKQLDQPTLDAMHTFIQGHEGLRPFDKVRAMSSLEGAIRGKVPTNSEQKLLQRVFGADTTRQLVDSIPFWAKAKNLGVELLNVPRALMASFDLSAPFRQGLVAGVSHPQIFFKNFHSMVKAFGSERVYQNIMNEIYERPTFPLMQQAKLPLTEIGIDPHTGTTLEHREEQFMSNLAERIPFVGRMVRASDRAYTAFLNKTRADVFDHLIQQAAESGVNLHDPKVPESIAKFVGSATGRGSLGAFQAHAVTLNTLLFSPRLLASRFNFLNPVYYMSLDPFARKEALKAARNLVGTMGLVLYLAKKAGAQVNTDPTNADFAKIKFGNTRIDLAGGFQQPVRLLAELFEGKVTSSTTGKVINLGPQGVGHLSRKDIAQRFFEGKLAPVPSLINDLFQGTSFAGQPLSVKTELFSRMIPLLAQDANDLANQHGGLGTPRGLAAGFGGYGLGLFGIGEQTYSAKKKKAAGGSQSYSGNSGYGGSSGYSGNSGYSSGGGYGP